MGCGFENHGFKPFTHPVGCVASTCCKPGTQQRIRDGVMKETWPVLAFISSVQFSSVAQLCPTLLRPHGLQHTRPPYPSPTPGVYPNSCPLSRWCHAAILSSVLPFSSFPQSLPASGSFPMSQSFTSSSQSIGVSVSASVLPMNIQGWFPLGLTGLISLQSKGPQKSSPTPQFKSINSLMLSFPDSPILTSIHDYWKSHRFD